MKNVNRLTRPTFKRMSSITEMTEKEIYNTIGRADKMVTSTIEMRNTAHFAINESDNEPEDR